MGDGCVIKEFSSADACAEPGLMYGRRRASVMSGVVICVCVQPSSACFPLRVRRPWVSNLVEGREEFSEVHNYVQHSVCL